MARDTKPGESVQVSIVWVPSEWDQPPVADGEAAFALDAANELSIHCVVVSVLAGQPVQACLDANLTDAAQTSLSQRSHGASIWGRRITTLQQIAAGDRIELLGPISADPKSERRARVKAERNALASNRWRR